MFILTIIFAKRACFLISTNRKRIYRYYLFNSPHDTKIDIVFGFQILKLIVGMNY